MKKHWGICLISIMEIAGCQYGSPKDYELQTYSAPAVSSIRPTLFGSAPSSASETSQQPRTFSAPLSAVAIDADTGATLYEVEADAQINPAGLTRFMTLYVLFDKLDAGKIHLDEKLTVSSHARDQPPAHLDLTRIDEITVEEAIRSLALNGDNDTPVVIAENVGGSERAFVDQMNQTANAIGLKNSLFKHPGGLMEPGHVTTARDMAILVQSMWKRHPGEWVFFSEQEYLFRGRRLHNRWNKNIYPGAEVIKAGFDPDCRFNLVVFAQRNGRRVIGVTLRSPSGNASQEDMAILLDKAFNSEPH